MSSSELTSQGSQSVDARSLMAFEKGLQELEKLKSENSEMEKTFFSKDRLIQDLEDQIMNLKEDLRLSYDKEKEAIKEMLQSEYLQALQKNKEEIEKLSQDKLKLSKEVSSWQQQYILLSQQNVSSTDLVEQIGSVVTENIRLNQLIDELNSKSILRSREIKLVASDNAKQSSSVDGYEIALKKEIEELKRVKHENEALEKTFFTREQFDAELQDKLDALKNEFMEMSKHDFNQALSAITDDCNSRVSKLKDELESIISQKQRVDKELASWREQYIKLSQQNLSHSDLLEEITNLKNDNLRLIKSQEEASIQKLLTSDKASETSSMLITQSSQCDLKTAHEDELKSLFYTKEQLDDEIEKHLLEQKSNLEGYHAKNICDIKNEITCDFNRDIERLKTELKAMSEEREKYSEEARIWQIQYSNLSAQSLIHNNLEEQLSLLRKENNSLKVTIEDLNSHVDSLMTDLEQKSLKHDQEMSAVIEENNKLQSALTSLNDTLKAEMDSKLNACNRVESLQEELETLRHQCNELGKHDEEMRHAKEVLEFEIKSLRNRLETSEDEKKLSALKQADEINSLISSLQSEHRSQMEKTENEFNQKIIELQSIHRVECDQLRSKHQDDVESLNILMTQLNSKVTAVGVEKDDVENNLSRVVEALHHKVSALEEELKDKIDKLQVKAELEVTLQETKSLYEAKITALTEEHQNSLHELKDKLLSLNQMQLKLAEISEQLERVTKERDSTMESLQNVYCEKVELKLNFDKLASEKERLHKKVSKLSDKNKFLAMAKATLNKSVGLKSASARSSHVISEAPVSSDFEDSQSMNFITDQEYKDLLEEKQVLQSELIECIPKSDVVNIGSRVVITKDKKSAFEKLGEMHEDTLEDSRTLFNELKTKHALEMLQAKKKQIALIEKLQTFMESQIKMDVLHETESQKLALKSKESDNLLDSASEGMPISLESLKRDFSTQCSEEISLFWVKTWLKRIMIYFEDENKLLLESGDQAYHKIFSELSEKILDFKSELEQFSSQPMMPGGKDVSCDTDGLASHLLDVNEGISKESISQMALELEYNPVGFQDIYLDDCSSEVLLSDLNPLCKSIRLTGKSEHMLLDEEHSPKKVVSHARLVEIQHLRSQLSEATEKLHTFDHQKNVMAAEFDMKLLSLMEEHDMNKVSLMNEIASLNKEITDLQQKLKQNNLNFERVVAEKDLEIANKVSEVTRIEELHGQAFNDAIAKHEEKEAALSHALSTSKMQISDLESRIEAVCKEKIILEQEFLNEMEELTKEHDSRIKSLKESFGKENREMSSKLNEYQEKILNLSDELELFQSYNLRLSETLSNMKAEECLAKAEANSQSMSIGETWTMRLNSLEEAKLEVEKSLENAKIDIDRLTIENTKLCVELERFKNNKADGVSVEVETDAVYGVSDDVTNRILCLREEKALLASMVERLTNEKDQLLVAMMSRNQHLEFDLSNMELEDDEVERDERSDDPRIKLLEAEKELLANMLEKVSTENEKLLSYLKQKECVEVDDTVGNELKGDALLAKLKNESIPTVDPDRDSPAFSDQLEAFQTLETEKRSLELTVESLNLLLNEKQQTIELLNGQLDSMNAESKSSFVVHDLQSMYSQEQLQVKNDGSELLALSLPEQSVELLINQSKEFMDEGMLASDLQGINECKRMDSSSQTSDLTSITCNNLQDNLIELRQELTSGIMNLSPESVENYDISTINIDELIKLFSKLVNETSIARVAAFPSCPEDHVTPQTERLVGMKILAKTKPKVAVVFENSNKKFVNSGFVNSSISDIELQKLANFNAISDNNIIQDTSLDNLMEQKSNDQQSKLLTLKKAKLLKSRKLQEKNEEKESLKKQVDDLTESNRALENANQVYAKEIETLRSERDLLLQQYEVNKTLNEAQTLDNNDNENEIKEICAYKAQIYDLQEEILNLRSELQSKLRDIEEYELDRQSFLNVSERLKNIYSDDGAGSNLMDSKNEEVDSLLNAFREECSSLKEEQYNLVSIRANLEDSISKLEMNLQSKTLELEQLCESLETEREARELAEQIIEEMKANVPESDHSFTAEEISDLKIKLQKKCDELMHLQFEKDSLIKQSGENSILIDMHAKKAEELQKMLDLSNEKLSEYVLGASQRTNITENSHFQLQSYIAPSGVILPITEYKVFENNVMSTITTSSDLLDIIDQVDNVTLDLNTLSITKTEHEFPMRTNFEHLMPQNKLINEKPSLADEIQSSIDLENKNHRGQEEERLDCKQPLDELHLIEADNSEEAMTKTEQSKLLENNSYESTKSFFEIENMLKSKNAELESVAKELQNFVIRCDDLNKELLIIQEREGKKDDDITKLNDNIVLIKEENTLNVEEINLLKEDIKRLRDACLQYETDRQQKSAKESSFEKELNALVDKTYILNQELNVKMECEQVLRHEIEELKERNSFLERKLIENVSAEMKDQDQIKENLKLVAHLEEEIINLKRSLENAELTFIKNQEEKLHMEQMVKQLNEEAQNRKIELEEMIKTVFENEQAKALMKKQIHELEFNLAREKSDHSVSLGGLKILEQEVSHLNLKLNEEQLRFQVFKEEQDLYLVTSKDQTRQLLEQVGMLEKNLDAKSDDYQKLNLALEECQKNLDDKCHYIEKIDLDNNSLKMQLNDFTSVQQELQLLKDIFENERIAKAELIGLHVKEVSQIKSEIEHLKFDLQSKCDECLSLHSAIQDLNLNLDSKCEKIKTAEEANTSLKMKMDSLEEELTVLRESLEHEKRTKHDMEIGHAADVIEMKAEQQKLRAELEAKAEKCDNLQLDLNALQESLNEKGVILKSIEEDNVSLKIQIGSLESAQKELIASREVLEHENLVKANSESEMTNRVQDIEKKMKEKCNVIEAENVSLKVQLEGFATLQHELTTAKEVLQKEKISRADFESFYAKEVLNYKDKIENLESELISKNDNFCSLQILIQALQKDLDVKHEILKKSEEANTSLKAQINSIQDESIVVRGNLEHEMNSRQEMEMVHAADVLEMKTENEKLRVELEAKAEKYNNLQLDLNALQESLNERCVTLKSIEEENISLKIQIDNLETAQKLLISSEEVLERENLVKANLESEFTNIAQDFEKKMKEKCDAVKSIEEENASLKAQLKDFVVVQNELATAKEVLQNEKHSTAQLEAKYAKDHESEIQNLKKDLETKLRLKDDECFKMQEAIKNMQINLDEQNDVMKNLEKNNNYLTVKLNEMELLEAELAILRRSLEEANHDKMEMKKSQTTKETELRSEIVKLTECQSKYTAELSLLTNELEETKRALDLERFKYEENSQFYNSNIELLKKEHDHIFDRLNENIGTIVSFHEIASREHVNEKSRIAAENLKLQDECHELKASIKQIHCQTSNQSLEVDKIKEMLEIAQNSLIQVQFENQKCKEDCMAKCNELLEKDEIIQELSRKFNDLENNLQLTMDKGGPTKVEYESLKIECDRALNTVRDHSDEIMALKTERDMLQNEMKELEIVALNKQKTVDVLQETLEKKLIEIDTIQSQSKENEKSHVKIAEALNHEILKLNEQLNSSLTNTKLIEMEILSFQAERRLISEKLGSTSLDSEELIERIDNLQLLINKFDAQEEHHKDQVNLLNRQIEDLKCTTLEFEMLYKTKCSEIEDVKSSHELLVSTYSCDLEDLKKTITSERSESNLLKCCLMDIENRLGLLESDSRILENELRRKDCEISDKQCIINKLETSVKDLTTCLHLERNLASEKDLELFNLRAEIMTLRNHLELHPSKVLAKQSELTDAVTDASRSQLSDTSLSMETCSDVIKQDSILSSVSEYIIDGEIKNEIGSEEFFSDSVGTPQLEISSTSAVHDIDSQSYHTNDLDKAAKSGIIVNAKSSKASEADDDFDEVTQTQTGSEFLKQESMSLKKQLFEMESMLKDTINELHMTLNETGSSGETCNSVSEEYLRSVESDRESLQSSELRTSSEKEVETVESALSVGNQNDIEVALDTSKTDAYNYSAEDIIIAVDKRVEIMSKNKVSCFVFDHSTVDEDDKNIANSSKIAKLEHAKLLKTKKLQEKEMEKLKLKSAELEGLCNKLKNDYALVAEENSQISSEKYEAIKRIALLEEELDRIRSDNFGVGKIDQSISCCIPDDKRSGKAEMDYGAKIDLSDSSCQTSFEVGLSGPSTSQIISSKSVGEANANEVSDTFRHLQEYEVQEAQGDIIEQWKQVDDHVAPKVDHNISRDTQTDSSAFSVINLKEFRDISVEATICHEAIDVQTDAKVYNDVSVETIESQNGQNLEAELRELKTLNEELRQEIIVLDGEKLDLMSNCLEMKKRQSELDLQNENLVDKVKLLSIEKEKQDLYEKEHEKLISTLDKVSTCDKEVGTSELSLAEGQSSDFSIDDKVNLRRILQTVFNIPTEMNDTKIEDHLLNVRDNLEKQAEAHKKVIVADEEDKKLNEIGLDKVQLETSIATLKSLTVNSSEMTKILYVLEKQIEMFYRYQSKMTDKCDDLLSQCVKLEEENGLLTNECEKLKSEYEHLKQDSERAYNALKLSCFDNINRNDGWNNATNEDGLSTGLMSASLLSPGLKSPSSYSGSETFLLSDDGRTSCFEIDELQAKIHHLEKENNELKLNANRDDSGSSEGHLRQSDSSACSHALQGSSDDSDKMKLESHSSHESECLRGRKCFSPSMASLHAERFLIRSPRSITSTSNDYQLEAEEARGKTTEDYMCLQNDFKRFKLKVRTEYMKLKNRLVETLKDYNYLKMKYQEVCDASRFHYLCDNNLLLTENNALKIRIQDLENAISRLVQENETLSGAIENGGAPDASSEMKQLNEKISQQELQISILQSDCNCLSERNALLEKQQLETEKVSTFELNSDLLEARPFNLNQTSDASIQVDEIPDTCEQLKAALCVTEINKEIYMESLTLVQSEPEKKEAKKTSKSEKPISRLPLRKVSDQKSQKSKAEMPKVPSKSSKPVDIQVSVPPPKESKTSNLAAVPTSQIPEQKCKRCQDLEKECDKLKEQASKYAEELEVLRNNAIVEPAKNHEHNMDDWEMNEISKEPSIDRLQVTLKIRPDQLSLKLFGSEKLDRNSNINYILEGEELNDGDEENDDIDDDLSQFAEQVIQDTSRLILDGSFGNPELSSTGNEDLLFFESDAKTERSNTPDSNAAFSPSQDAANFSRLSTLTIEEGNEVELFSVKPLSEAEVKRKLVQTFDHGGRHSCSSAVSENVGELDLESLGSHPQLEQLENVEVSIKCEISTVLTKFGISALTDLVAKTNEQLLKENVLKLSEVMKEMEASYKKEVELLCMKHQEEMNRLRGQINSTFELPPMTPASSISSSNINFNNNNINNNNDDDNVSLCWSKTDVNEEQDHWQEICLLRESYDKELNSLLEKLELAKVQTEEKQVVINALEVKEEKLQSDLNSSLKEIERLKTFTLPSPTIQLPDASPSNKDCIHCLEKDETIASQNQIIEQLRDTIRGSQRDQPQDLDDIGSLKDDPSRKSDLEKLAALLEEKDSEIASLKSLIDELTLKLEYHANPDYIRAYERYLSDIEEGDVEDADGPDEKFLCSTAEVVGNEDGDDDDDDCDNSTGDDDDGTADSSDRDGDDEDDDDDVKQVVEQEFRDDGEDRVTNLIDFDNPIDETNKDKKDGDDDVDDDDDDDDEANKKERKSSVRSVDAADEESDSEEPCLKSARWEQLIADDVVSLVDGTTASVDLSSDFNKKVDDDNDDDGEEYEDHDDDADAADDDDADADDDDDDNNGNDAEATDHPPGNGAKIIDPSLPGTGVETQGDDHPSLAAEFIPGKGSAKKLSHHYDESVDVDSNDDDDDEDDDEDNVDEENGGERVDNESSVNASEVKDSFVSEDNDNDIDVGVENVDRQCDQPTETAKSKARPIDCAIYAPLDTSYLVSNGGDDDDDDDDGDVGRGSAAAAADDADDDDDEKADNHGKEAVVDIVVKEVVPSSSEVRHADALHRLVDDCAFEVGLDLSQLRPENVKHRVISLMNELKKKSETTAVSNNNNEEEDDDDGRKGGHDDNDCEDGVGNAESCNGVPTRDPNAPELGGVDRRESIVREMQLEIVGLKEAVGREEQLRMTLEFMEEELKRERCSFEERVTEEVKRRLDELKEAVSNQIETRGNDKSVGVDDDDDHDGGCADASGDDDDEHFQEIPMKMSQSGDSDDHHHHHRARIGSKDEVVKIRVKDLKNIKARLKTAESFNEHYHSTICHAGKIMHATEMIFLKFFKNFEPCVSSKAIRTTEELENKSSNNNVIDDIGNNVNNNERHSEFGGSRSSLEKLGGIEQMIDPTITDARRLSLADLEKDYTDDQSDCALVLEGSSRIEMAVRHLLRAIQVYEDKNKELEEVRDKLVEEKKILHLEKNRLNSELLEETDRNHRLDLDLNLAQSVIGGYQKEREELDSKLKEHQEEIIRLSLKVEELEDALRDHASAKEELRLKEEHIQRQTEQLQHSAIEEGIQELLRENNQLNEECSDLRDRLRRDKERFESQLTELDASNCQLQARIDALQKENIEAANDNKLRVEALEKQLAANKKYIENQSIEREQEIDRHQDKVKELESVLAEKEQTIRKNQKLKSDMQEMEEQLNRKLNTCTNLDEELSRLKQVLKSRNEDIARLTSSNKLLEANLNNFYEKEAATTKDSSELDSTMVSKDNEAEFQAVQEMESLRMTLSKVEEALTLAKKSEKDLEERNSQLEKEIDEHEKCNKELKRNYLKLERREEELNEELTSLKMDAEQRCLERHAMKGEVDDIKSNLSESLKAKEEEIVQLGRQNALLTLELEEISTRVSVQAETIDKLKKELDTLKLERDQLIKSIHSLENQNLENQIEIQELSAKANEDRQIIKFDLGKEEADLMRGLQDDNEMLRADNSRLKEQLSARLPNGTGFSLFSSISHGSPEAVRKSTGSLPGKSISLDESLVFDAQRKKLNSPSLASMDEDDKSNSYASRRSRGSFRNDHSGRKVVFSNDIQSSHQERVIESILLKFDVEDLEEVERLVEAKSSEVLKLTTRLEQEQQEKVTMNLSLNLLENKLKNIESESRELRGSLASREVKVQELIAQLEAVNTSHHDDLCNLSRAMSEKDENISSLVSQLGKLSESEEKKSQQINQLRSKMADQETAIGEMAALKAQHKQLFEKCSQLESRFKDVMAENRKLMHGDLEKNEVVEGLRRELSSARKTSEDEERRVQEEMKRLIDKNETTKQKLKVVYDQLKTSEDEERRVREEMEQLVQENEATKQKLKAACEQLESSEDREQLKLERLRLIHAKELQSLKISHQEELRKLEQHRDTLEVRNTSVKPEDVNITLAEFTTILPETSCDELSDDLQSILKKLHQEAMKVLTLSDFKYLEQLERQGAELERSRVEWNNEKQKMIEQQTDQIKSLQAKIVELQSNLEEERQKNQTLGKYLEEGEHKLKKLRTEKEKLRAKLVSEREASKALTRGFEAQRDEMEREFNQQREELNNSNTQKELLQRQHNEIKMKLNSIEEQLKRSKDAERKVGSSSFPDYKQIMSLELIEQTLRMIISLVKGKCIENALEALRCIQSDVHEILQEYKEKTSGSSLTKEVLNGKMLEHNATLLNHIHQICNEKAELIEKVEQLRKEAYGQRNHNQLLESFDEERKRLLEENKMLSDNLVEARKELRFASTDDRRKELHKLYGKYLRAESFRKSLAYQKKYLLMVLEEFQESEQATLRAIARMTSHAHARHGPGFEDSICDEGSSILSGIKRDFQRSIKFSSGKDQKRHNNLGPLERFRSAARVVVAVSRLKFLVKKWRKTVQQGPRASNSEILPAASLPSTSAFPSFTSISSLLDSRDPADGSRIPSMQGAFEERVMKSYTKLSRHLQRASHSNVANDRNVNEALGGPSRPTASATAILQTSPSERSIARDKKAIGFTPPSKLPSKIRSDEHEIKEADSSNYRLPPPVTSKEYLELVKNLKKRLDDNRKL